MHSAGEGGVGAREARSCDWEYTLASLAPTPALPRLWRERGHDGGDRECRHDQKNVFTAPVTLKSSAMRQTTSHLSKAVEVWEMPKERMSPMRMSAPSGYST